MAVDLPDIDIPRLTTEERIAGALGPMGAPAQGAQPSPALPAGVSFVPGQPLSAGPAGPTLADVAPTISGIASGEGSWREVAAGLPRREAPPPTPGPMMRGAGGMGRMPAIEPQYFEGGAQGEAERVRARYRDDKDELERQLFGGEIEPADYQKQLAALKDAQTQGLARAAKFAASGRGTMDRMQRLGQEGVQQQYAGAQDLARIEGEAAQQQQDAAQSAQMKADEAQQETEQRRADYDRHFNQRLSDFEEANRRLSQERIDPNSWFENKSTGGKVLATIGVMLGAAASRRMMGGSGVNGALDTMNRRIQEDIDAQKVTLANRRAGLAAQGTIMGRMRMHFGDMQSAELAAKQHIYQQYSAQLQAQAAGSKNQRVKAQLSQLADGMARQAAQFEDTQKLRAQVEAEELTRQAAMARGAAAAQREKLTAMGGYQLLSGKDPLSNVIWNPAGGSYGVAEGVDNKRVDTIREMVAAHTVNNQELDRLIQLADGGVSGAIPFTDAATEFQQGFQLIRAPMKKEIAGAAESDQEKEAIDEMIIGRSGVTAGALGLAAKALRRYRGHGDRKLESTLQSFGVQPADVRTGQDVDDPTKRRAYIKYGAPAGGGGAQLRDDPR